jgi:hypothetical protein
MNQKRKKKKFDQTENVKVKELFLQEYLDQSRHTIHGV